MVADDSSHSSDVMTTVMKMMAMMVGSLSSNSHG
jgi:hypothetical protein